VTIYSFETAKAGVEEKNNEDSFRIRQINMEKTMVLMSDGASTGVFSKEWSDHITNNIDSSWLKSVDDLEYGLNTLRESFKPNITRQTALRKFLMEGSYATLLALLIEEDTGWFSSKLDLTLYSIGDVCVFVFSEDGSLEFSFPYTRYEDFNNVPDLIRTSEKLQKKTPYVIKPSSFKTSAKSLIVVASDAISEYLFQAKDEGKLLSSIEDIVACENNENFKKLMDIYRQEMNMKNDDVTVCVLTKEPELYFRKGVNHGLPGA